jgi:hypothetical protein
LKPSIWLEENGPAPVPGIPLGEGSPTPMPRTPPSNGGVASALEADPGTSAGPTGQGREPRVEIVAITELPDPDVDWKGLISEYLQLRMIPDKDTETRRLTRWATEYLIHNGELYRRSTSCLLQRCVPIEEGKTLLLNIHEGVYGHHAHQEAWSERPSDKVCTGQWPPATQPRL